MALNHTNQNSSNPFIMNKFDIQPYIGVGLLKFGMKKKDVAIILGQADETKAGDELEEYRKDNGLQLVYGQNGELVEISMYAYANIPNVKLRDIDIFKIDGEEAFKYLIKADGKPFEIVGVVVLLNLGISLGGFMHNDEPGEKNLTVFAKGRMDRFLNKLKPYKSKFK